MCVRVYMNVSMYVQSMDTHHIQCFNIGKLENVKYVFTYFYIYTILILPTGKQNNLKRI